MISNPRKRKLDVKFGCRVVLKRLCCEIGSCSQPREKNVNDISQKLEQNALQYKKGYELQNDYQSILTNFFDSKEEYSELLSDTSNSSLDSPLMTYFSGDNFSHAENETSPKAPVFKIKNNSFDYEEESNFEESGQFAVSSFYDKKDKYLNPLERKKLRNDNIKYGYTFSEMKDSKLTNSHKKENSKPKKVTHKKNISSRRCKKTVYGRQNAPKIASKKIYKRIKYPSIKYAIETGISENVNNQQNNGCIANLNKERKFFTSRNLKDLNKKVFTTTLAWKKGLQVEVKLGASVKNKTCGRKQALQPKPKDSGSQKPFNNRKAFTSIENVSEEMKKIESPIPLSSSVVSKTLGDNKCLLDENNISSSNDPLNMTCLDSEADVSLVNEETSIFAVDENYSKNPEILPENPFCLKPHSPKTEKAKFYPLFNKRSLRDKKLEQRTTPRTSSPDSKRSGLNNSRSKFFMKSTDRDCRDQLIIDAGQKEIGAKQCPTCNMVYTKGDPQDEKTHSKYHEMFLSNLKFPGWKKEHVVGEFLDGRAIMVTRMDRNFMLRKIEDILKIVDRDLGFPDLGFPKKPNPTFVLFISNDKKVLGCLVAESITQAYRVVLDTSCQNVSPCLPHKEQKESPSKDSPKGNWCSASEPVKALCGISRIWTAPGYRRRKIASRMVDCLRCHFVYGYVISTDELAFSDPSLDGREFASCYTRTPYFLVYK